MSQIVRNQNKTYQVRELLQRDNDNTPDFLDRKLEKYIPVFVYGTLKAGGRFHEVLSDAPCLGDAYTVTPTFTMHQASGDFPVVMSIGKSGANTHHVYGEVYIVNARVLLELDRIEANNEMYKREEKWVFLMDQGIKGKAGMVRPGMKVWIYVGVPDFWSGLPLVPVSPKKSNNKMFYEWSIPVRSALKYAPKSSVQPDAHYRSSVEAETNWMWDQHYQDDAMYYQDTDWDAYDEEIRKKNDKFAEGDSLPPFDI